MTTFFHFAEMLPADAIHFSNYPMPAEQADHLRELAELVAASPMPDAYAYCRVVVAEQDGFRIRISKTAPSRDNPFSN